MEVIGGGETQSWRQLPFLGYVTGGFIMITCKLIIRTMIVHRTLTVTLTPLG